MTGGREAVFDAARQLFGSRGYAEVSVRDIAELAGVSPALVMKHGGTKLELFRAVAATQAGPRLFEVAVAGLGEHLVRRTLAAHREGRPSPLASTVALMVGAPDLEERRAAVRRDWLEPIAERLVASGTPEAEAVRRARAALAVLVGLVTSQRLLGLFEPGDDQDLLSRYAPLVQAALESPGTPITPGAEGRPETAS